MAAFEGAGATKGQVTAWALNVEKWQPDEATVQALLETVQPEERTRIEKFRFDVDRRRALAGRVMIRNLIAKEFAVQNADIELARSDKGKPELVKPNPGKFSFNLSHHGSWVVLVSHKSRVIGVDVVKYEHPRGSRSLEDFFTTMSKSFTPEEWAYIRNGDETGDLLGDEHLKRFYKEWSLKEAYIKAIGVGIGFGLQRASFEPREDDTAQLVLDGKVNEEFTFQITHLDENHCAAVALEASNDTTEEPVKIIWTHLDYPTGPGESEEASSC
uniref:holo-[acyl-carrier-protein] synthase n=2 Tax=unclassified Aurantiochytrium TaxID=1547518 RepID=A0A7H0ZVK3_9STRA|nr:phosphopantetheinyl transferase [Aurantiochytrium sp.]BBF90575.1 phosphopantetheinyl transferase [Aurantiochytrium sp. OH4]